MGKQRVPVRKKNLDLVQQRKPIVEEARRCTVPQWQKPECREKRYVPEPMPTQHLLYT